MPNRSRIVLGSLAGAFVIHIAALACSGSGSVVGGPPDASTAARDGGFVDALASVVDAVGHAVHDVAAKVVDGEVRDAYAGGRVIEVACDQETTTTTTRLADAGTPASESAFTYWYAVVPGVIADPRTVPRMTANTCDPENFNPPSPSQCTPGYRCETTGVTFPPSPCTPATPYVVGDGRVVINCGFRNAGTNAGATTTSGIRYRRAYVRID